MLFLKIVVAATTVIHYLNYYTTINTPVMTTIIAINAIIIVMEIKHMTKASRNMEIVRQDKGPLMDFALNYTIPHLKIYEN